MTTSSRTSSRATRGFTLIEVLIAMVVALITVMAIATAQVSIFHENRGIAEKMEAADFNRQLREIFANDRLCTFNLTGAVVGPEYPATPTTPATFKAELNRLVSVETATPTAEEILAQINQDLPRRRYPLPVQRVFVGDMVKQGPVSASGIQVYSGAIQVTIADPAGTNAPKLVRPLQAIKVSKQFFVNNSTGAIVACGTAAEDVMYFSATAIKNNGPMADTTACASATAPPSPAGCAESWADCPADMVAVGGGWAPLLPTDPPMTVDPSCPPGGQVGAVASEPETAGNLAFKRWKVIVLCQPYRAYVVCMRQSFSKGP